jgi:tetratricopeptide (TPR) repeat protein
VADSFPAGDYRHIRALLDEELNLVRLHDARAASAMLAIPLPKSKVPGVVDEVTVAFAQVRGRIQAVRGNWKAAAAAYETGRLPGHGATGQFQLVILSLVATARSESGNSAALAAIRDTPDDCYDCLIARGDIRGVERQWDSAAYWFASAIRQGPSPPFAYNDWGEMLLQKGDADGAIAQFKEANMKGPHFADPLEGWGEALMAKNRSDLALAKFEDAAKYAPNWGRLHLKWGEALFYAAQKDEAKKQFAIAAALDLAPSEKAQLAKF